MTLLAFLVFAYATLIAGLIVLVFLAPLVALVLAFGCWVYGLVTGQGAE